MTHIEDYRIKGSVIGVPPSGSPGGRGPSKEILRNVETLSDGEWLELIVDIDDSAHASARFSYLRDRHGLEIKTRTIDGQTHVYLRRKDGA